MDQHAAGPRGSILALDSVVGGWRVVRQLGSGGMAEVYLAQHPRIPRVDVLKVMRPWLADDPRFRVRFHAEADHIASLSHPNVITVYDQGEEDGRLYLVMQYAVGGDLRTMLEHEGRLAPPRALEIAGQVANALDAGHEIGLVHRDVKPDNVLLDAPHTGYPDRALLCDFGISTLLDSSTHLTHTGELLFSPTYAAPEQFEGKPVTGRADQYSLGCLLYELLAGKPPFTAPTVPSAMKAHLFDAAPPLPADLGLPPAMDGVLGRALAKDPADRFEDCRSFLDAAAAAVGPGPAPGMTQTSVEAGRHRSWLLPSLHAAVLAGLSLALALTTLISWFSTSDRRISPWTAVSVRYFLGGVTNFHIAAFSQQRLGPYVLVVAVLLLAIIAYPARFAWGIALAVIAAGSCLWSIVLFQSDGDPSTDAAVGIGLALALCSAYAVVGLFALQAWRRQRRAEVLPVRSG
jgi:serine/threonine protein kinase